MRNIPEDNLAYPILIKHDNGGSGSGFFLKTDTKIFLVTAKHVLLDEKSNPRSKILTLICQTRELNDESSDEFIIDVNKAKILKHSKSDIAAIEMGTIKSTDDPQKHFLENCDGITLKKSGKGDGVSVGAQDSTKLLKDVLISNDVFLYGYPTSLGLEDSPQFDYNKPLLRKGIVANVNKKQGTIILDCPVYYGNSGGPVVEVSLEGREFKHRVIGVVSQFIPFVEKWVNSQNRLHNIQLSNSGYSVAVSMDRVFELIGYTPPE